MVVITKVDLIFLYVGGRKVMSYCFHLKINEVSRLCK